MTLPLNTENLVFITCEAFTSLPIKSLAVITVDGEVVCGHCTSMAGLGKVC